jgi:2-oxoisovalerate dehydrogenase E2 component (dihydrolipoyl transacylase)
MSDAQVFRLPDVGEGLTEAEIVAWHVQIGDTVSVNDILLDVETAKSVVELPSPFAGVVLELHAKEGDTLAVEAPLTTIGEPVDVTTAPRALAPAAEPVPAPAPAGGVTEAAREAPLILVGTGPKEAANRRVRIRRTDEPTYTRPRPGAQLPLAAPKDTEASDIRVPVKGVRRVTAEAMVRSAFSAPHAAMWTTVDVTATMDMVRRLRADRAWAGVRVSPLLLVARTVALAVRRYPEINAWWDEAAQEIVRRRALNLGIAAATPRGLMVPNIKDAGSMSLHELARALDHVIDQARAGKLTVAEMSDGTLTLTNVGTFGVEGATPILNPPEAAILALGSIRPRPWVVDGAVAVRDVMTLSISIDHRLVDGELGANVLNHVASVLNDPALALL